MKWKRNMKDSVLGICVISGFFLSLGHGDKWKIVVIFIVDVGFHDTDTNSFDRRSGPCLS